MTRDARRSRINNSAEPLIEICSYVAYSGSKRIVLIARDLSMPRVYNELKKSSIIRPLRIRHVSIFVREAISAGNELTFGTMN